uniref:Ycf53 n=1 Tax=Grateloupia turuturu TaxID=118375 RepID=UPI0021D5321A|nr:Ycf53 [Grateloupia turuturu]UXC96769.1 Ycf53 [Grateloupia turuturu]
MTKQAKINFITIDKIVKLENSISTKEQIKISKEIAKEGEGGQRALLKLLVHRLIEKQTEISYLDGIIFETLRLTEISYIKEELDKFFDEGLIKLDTNLNYDYQPLQKLLISQEFLEADKLTQVLLCKLAGLNENNKRNWLYFTDISLLPPKDLYIIDKLWRIYSRGKFGFSIQRQIWLTNNCNWEKLWKKIGWKNQGTPCRYPNEFIWDTSAPSGHLPLFNQLRGVQVLSALFQHIVWDQSI